MHIRQSRFTVDTSGRGTVELTSRVQACVGESGIRDGLCQVFLHHTSASLMICENADPQVLRDMETFMSELAPDGSRLFEHDAEGPDDMPAHVRSVLTGASLSIPVADGRCDLGTWQGVYLWEHRHGPRQRRMTVTLMGE